MRLAIIGGDAAGMSAAHSALRGDPGLDVVVFERGAYTSYSACGIPYYVGGLVEELGDLVARTPAAHRTAGVDVRTQTTVEAIDLDLRQLTVRTADGRTGSEGFDQLVVATGARAVPPPIDGAEQVPAVRTLDVAERFRAEVDASSGPAVVIGGGYIGIEMAEALVHRGIDVTLVEQAPQLLATTLDADMAELVAEATRATGVRVLLDTSVTAVEHDAAGRPVRVVTSAGTLDATHVVLATGVRPEVTVATEAGLAAGESGALRAGRDQRCPGVDGVFAAGDCAESHHRLLDRPVNVQLGTHANKQGRVAGVNAAGGDLAFPGVIGTSLTRICSREVARTGLGEREALDAGFDAVAEVVTAQTRSGYLSDAGEIAVKLVVERGSGRLLGAQLVGAETSGKRIDVLALAVWQGMDVEELQWVDLAYAPPVAPVLDPVLVAARAAHKRV